jgi:hypothetical protein
MSLSLEQLLIADLMGYKPMTQEESAEPADTSLCNRKVTIQDGWPHITWKGELVPVPTMEELEEWTFDSVCPTPGEDDVEPDHDHSWLRILGMI